MLILLNESGQIGNRLRSLSSLVALGLENKQAVICPVVPREYFEYFKLHFDGNSEIKVSLSYNPAFSTFTKIVGKVSKGRTINVMKGRIEVFTDWISFAMPELSKKYYPQIREFFGFTNEFSQFCKTKIPLKKHNSEKLVAVHLRRGDYKNWRNGVYYYEIEQFIQQMRFLYTENNNVHFVIFSNEVINQSIFDGEPYDISFMTGNAYEDLCCMSLCDYIIGPPSTFSAWAGYMGDKELVWMKKKDYCYSFSEFQNVPNSMSTTKEFWTL